MWERLYSLILAQHHKWRNKLLAKAVVTWSFSGAQGPTFKYGLIVLGGELPWYLLGPIWTSKLGVLQDALSALSSLRICGWEQQARRKPVGPLWPGPQGTIFQLMTVLCVRKEPKLGNRTEFSPLWSYTTPLCLPVSLSLSAFLSLCLCFFLYQSLILPSSLFLPLSLSSQPPFPYLLTTKQEMWAIEKNLKAMNGTMKPNSWSGIQELKYNFYSGLTYRGFENEYLFH